MLRIILLVLVIFAVVLLVPRLFSRSATPAEGSAAPDFTLTDQNGNKVSLHDFKGKKNVALAFYIFAFTGG